MIKPTVGRIVWYYKDALQTNIVQHGLSTDPLAAQICMVWNDRLVNLHVIDANGTAHAVTSVELVQEGEPAPSAGRYCKWMPYQVGQAKKNESEEK